LDIVPWGYWFKALGFKGFIKGLGKLGFGGGLKKTSSFQFFSLGILAWAIKFWQELRILHLKGISPQKGLLIGVNSFPKKFFPKRFPKASFGLISPFFN